MANLRCFLALTSICALCGVCRASDQVGYDPSQGNLQSHSKTSKRAKKVLQQAAKPTGEDFTHMIPRIKGDVIMVCPEGFALHENKCLMHLKAAKVETCPYGSFRNKKGKCINIDSTRPEKVCPAGYEYYYKGCIRRYQLPTAIKCPYGYELNDSKICATTKQIPPQLQCPPGFHNPQQTSSGVFTHSGKHKDQNILCYKHHQVEPNWLCPGHGYISTRSETSRMCEREVPAEPIATCAEGTTADVVRKEVGGGSHKHDVSIVDCVESKEILGRYVCPNGYVAEARKGGEHTCVREQLIPMDLEQNPLWLHEEYGGPASTWEEVDSIVESLLVCDTGYELFEKMCRLTTNVDPIVTYPCEHKTSDGPSNDCEPTAQCPDGYTLNWKGGGEATCLGEEVFLPQNACETTLQSNRRSSASEVKVMMVDGVSTRVLVSCHPEQETHKTVPLVLVRVSLDASSEFLDEATGEALDPSTDCISVKTAERSGGPVCIVSKVTKPILSCPRTVLDEHGNVVAAQAGEDGDLDDDEEDNDGEDVESTTRKPTRNRARSPPNNRSLLGDVDEKLSCVQRQLAPKIPTCNGVDPESNRVYKLQDANMITTALPTMTSADDPDPVDKYELSQICVFTETTSPEMLCPTGMYDQVITAFDIQAPHRVPKRLLGGLKHSPYVYPDEESGLCAALMVAEPDNVCPAGYKYGTYDKDYGSYLSKDLCERIEFAEHQEVCPHGYEREKPNDKKKACVAEKEVPPTLICPPGYWMKSRSPLHEHGDTETKCVKTISVSPSLVAVHGDEYSACRPGANGAPSCELETRHYGEISPTKYKKGQKVHQKFSYE